MYKALLVGLAGGLFAAAPSSTNFTLQAHDFGSGAAASSSANYSLEGAAGAPAGALSSTNYSLPAGIRAATTAAVPAAPTFANPDSSYNRLKVTLNVSGQPADATYLIAISDDDFATTAYIQTDNTVGPTAGASNYQSYAAWGGASGFWVLGLEPNTSYKVKAAALHGDNTGSPFGPEASAATAAPSVTFAVTTSLAGSPPFNIGFGSLTPGSVISGSATILTDITTNAAHGGNISIKSQNAGLLSTLVSNTIASATADLAVANEGYGAQVTSVSESGGGPVTTISPFDGAGDNVGGLTTAWQQLAAFLTAVSGGNVTTTLKAKASAAEPTATDYADVLTISITLSF